MQPSKPWHTTDTTDILRIVHENCGTLVYALAIAEIVEHYHDRLPEEDQMLVAWIIGAVRRNDVEELTALYDGVQRDIEQIWLRTGLQMAVVGFNLSVIRSMDVYTLACTLFNAFVNPLGVARYPLPRTLNARFTRTVILLDLFPEDPRKVKYVAFQGHIVSVRTFSALPTAVQVAWDAACEKGEAWF